MVIRFTRKKGRAILVMLVIVVLEGLFSTHFLFYSYNSEIALRCVSAICLSAFIVEYIVWWRLTGELISTYSVFFLALFLFCTGQCIGWGTGMNLGALDVWNATEGGLDKSWLTKGVIYSMLGTAFFHIGAIISYSEKNNVKTEVPREYVTSMYKNMGKLMLLIIIPAFLAKTYQSIVAVAAGGYLAFYRVNSSRSYLGTLLTIVSDWYQPCCLILLIGNRESKIKRSLIILLMLIDVIASLYVGGRSNAVMTMLGIILAYHYMIKPIKVKQFLIISLLAYLFMGMLNGMIYTRGVSGRSLRDLLVLMSPTGQNVLGDFIGGLGWNITSITWTMILVPSTYPFRFGLSYIAALTSWIPSFFFGGKAYHPSTLYASLSSWLQNALRRTSGPGYTIIAEAYINFSWFGIFFLAIEGFFVAKIINRVSRKRCSDDMITSTMQIMFIMVVMKALIRDSMSSVIRDIVFTLLPMYFILYFYIINNYKSAESDNEDRNINMV